MGQLDFVALTWTRTRFWSVLEQDEAVPDVNYESQKGEKGHADHWHVKIRNVPVQVCCSVTKAAQIGKEIFGLANQGCIKVSLDGR